MASRAFDIWFANQPVVASVKRLSHARVSIVKFNDYQCPPCKHAEQEYDPVIHRLMQEFPGGIELTLKDFPLNPECNDGSMKVHQEACDAAEAVRFADLRGRRSEMEQWLWANQQTLSADAIFDAADRIAGPGLRAAHATFVPGIRADVSVGRAAGVSGTPTYFINGIEVPSGLPAEEFERAVRLELHAAEH